MNVLRSLKLDNKERITFSHFPFSVSIMGVLYMTKALTTSLEIPVLHTCTSNQEAITFSRRLSQLSASYWSVMLSRTYMDNMLISVQGSNKNLKLIPQKIFWNKIAVIYIVTCCIRLFPWLIFVLMPQLNIPLWWYLNPCNPTWV